MPLTSLTSNTYDFFYTTTTATDAVSAGTGIWTWNIPDGAKLLNVEMVGGGGGGSGMKNVTGGIRCGGGGASLNGFNSGAGGDGNDGAVRIIVFY